jgi:hypothetical protein
MTTTGGEAVTNWKPISTAPRDGTRILLATTNCPRVEIGHCAEDGHWVDDSSEAEGLQGMWFTTDRKYAAGPTHWAPLPEGPVTSHDPR